MLSYFEEVVVVYILEQLNRSTLPMPSHAGLKIQPALKFISKLIVAPPATQMFVSEAGYK
ncbi:hypothetical protein D8T61_08675 [Vibrio vulnificus]|nr:hypothetical protein D8T61_08675 [Vibrio vulnificus]